MVLRTLQPGKSVYRAEIPCSTKNSIAASIASAGSKRRSSASIRTTRSSAPHLSIGQEAISVAVCEALEPNQIGFGSYRGHALYLAKGGDLRQMIAELYGKATGCAQGKAVDAPDRSGRRYGLFGRGGHDDSKAVGYAYALKFRGSEAIVVSFFGDGATEEGVFHESLNFAALKQLPILFVCENIFLAFTPLTSVIPGRRFATWPRSTGFRPSVSTIWMCMRFTSGKGRDPEHAQAALGTDFLECMCIAGRSTSAGRRFSVRLSVENRSGTVDCP